jgi:hypothetical protein
MSKAGQNMVLISKNKGGTKWGLQVKNNFLNISIEINIFFNKYQFSNI